MNPELLDVLDLGMVCADLGEGFSRASNARGFWSFAQIDPDIAVAARRLLTIDHDKRSLAHDYGKFAESVFSRHSQEIGATDETRDYETPVELDDQLAECTPQFILRNIPKLERYYDMDRPLPFMIDDMPMVEALDDIEKVRDARLEPPEFSDHDNVEFLEDFRIFREEVFLLCPWEQVSRRAPDEDSPWHLKNSTSKLAKHMLEQKNTFFVFGTRGMTKMQLGDYRPEEKKKQETPRPSGIGMPTFGPG